MSKQVMIIVALAAVLAAGAGAFVVLRPHHAAPYVAPAPAAPAPPGAAAALQQVPRAKSDCWLPGPAPVPPNGATASAADMTIGRQAAQAFVDQLQNYQTCRNTLIDHPPAGVTPTQKQLWLDEGNAAVDEANEVANAFATQLRVFKANQAKH